MCNKGTCEMNTAESHALFSQKVTVLSFVSTACIVVMHAGSFMAGSQNVGVLFVRQFFTQYLCDFAVPFFFVMAGYWFAGGFCVCDAKCPSYVIFLKKKCKSLFIPYVIFCLYGLLTPALWIVVAYNLRNGLPWFDRTVFASSGFLDGVNRIFAVWGRDLPMYNGALWYVRALLLFFILAPIWRLVYRRLPIVFLLLFLALELYDPNLKIGGPICLQIGRSSYFFLGVYLTALRFPEIRISGRWTQAIWLIAITILAFQTVSKLSGDGGVVFELFHRVQDILILGAVWFGYDQLSVSKKVETFPWWIKCSFFIYCTHWPLIACQTTLSHAIGIDNAWCVLGLSLSVCFYVFVGVMFAYLLKRFLPSVYGLVGGGRG